MRIEWGSLVWLAYDAFLDSGEQFDCSEANGLLRVRVGAWELLPGLGEKLIGLQEGDERLIRLAPSEAFGEWDLKAVLTMRESRLAGEGPLEDGMMLQIETSTGLTAVCRAYRITEDRVALDFNHPLAGEALTLFVRVQDVVSPRPVPESMQRPEVPAGLPRWRS
ncbi:MAG TPA: FKBP-type peptidyl-prolyl cis-trans isomerase [Candidatus Methylomirabilis sp.]|nr:FKBP-type peptidyl-prolyl cis-trans isomerase [Candidatus Methylomirabilis sp.]